MRLSAQYSRPANLDEALAGIAAGGMVIAGGTDYYPARVGRAPVENLIIDITAISSLKGIEEKADHWRIGAITTWTEIIRADLPPFFKGLKLAAREVGGVQIQNAGTIAGNLCNASPAADGLPALISLRARVELLSQADVKPTFMLLEDFVQGNRKTAKRPDQLVAAILIPKPYGKAASHFLKLGARRYLVISIVMVGAMIELDLQSQISDARVVVGACAPRALRLPALEQALLGRKISKDIGEVAISDHLHPLAPIDDVRASAEYRVDVAVTLIRRTLNELGAQL